MRYHSKQRIAFILGTWILLLVVIIVAVTPVRNIVLTHLFPPATSSVTPIPPGDNLFYIQDSPRGSIDIDGHLTTHLPDMTKTPPDALCDFHEGNIKLSGYPLHLSRSSVPFPFPRCCPTKFAITNPS